MKKIELEFRGVGEEAEGTRKAVNHMGYSSTARIKKTVRWEIRSLEKLGPGRMLKQRRVRGLRY